MRAWATVTLVTGVAASLVLAACSGDGSTARPAPTTTRPDRIARGSPTPAGDWQKVAPASVGLDATKLDAIAKTAEVGKSNCLVVVKDGKLAGEWYFHGTGPDTAQPVFSGTKSYTSTLVGMAVDEGKARLSDPASRWIPEWAGTASAGVTLRNLLSNDSGRDWSLAQDYVRLVRAPDATAFGVGLGQAHPPGTVWAYNNSAIQTLERVVAGTLGPDVPAVAQQRIFAPLGMTHSQLTTDASGHALMYMGLRSTCRDMARFGSLFLNHGAWKGTSVVSARWVREATGASSTRLNAAYGLLWWLNRRGRIFPEAPTRGICARGNIGRQLLWIDPARDLVVVSRWSDGIGRLLTEVSAATPPR